jgi:hypothetical protein
MADQWKLRVEVPTATAFERGPAVLDRKVERS